MPVSRGGGVSAKSCAAYLPVLPEVYALRIGLRWRRRGRRRVQFLGFWRVRNARVYLGRRGGIWAKWTRRYVCPASSRVFNGKTVMRNAEIVERAERVVKILHDLSVVSARSGYVMLSLASGSAEVEVREALHEETSFRSESGLSS